MPSLEAVPDEIIRQILHFVSPEDNLTCIQLLSPRFKQLADESLLWRYHCRTSFHYWNSDHKFHEKLQRKVGEVDWKALWLTRKRKNDRAALLLDGILATKVGRLTKLEQICLLGYDAKDFLLEQCNMDEAAEDVLARRYYGNTALDSIHRGIAVEIWSRYHGQPTSTRGLETALGALDMFVLHDQPQDLDYIRTSFDGLAEQFRSEHPDLEGMSIREKALTLVQWLRAKNLTGMDNPEVNYRNLRNCFIGHALSDPRHPSLPIISSAMFCAVAERLGMLASCCAFPSHVNAMVLAPPGESLDGHAAEPGADADAMYLDPYGSDDEVPVQELRHQLANFTWMGSSDAFLSPAPVSIILQRAAQNIRATSNSILALQDDDAAAVELKRLRTGHLDLNLEAAYYGAIWAQVLTVQSPFSWDNILGLFLNRFALTWSEDAWIVEKYLLPVYDSFVATQAPRNRVGWENVREILGMLRNLDQRQPTINRRYTEEIHAKVRYKIGQVFRHKRYGYIGVINGWAATGTAALPTPHTSTDGSDDEGDSSAPQTPTVEAAPDGSEESRRLRERRRRSRTYYTCLRSTVDRMWVAQENITIVTDPSLIPESLFFMAGKFFKRFDREACKFVSNITEFYPDD